MVIIKNNRYLKSVLYAFLMVFFGVLAYIFLNSGFSTKTRIKVDYDNNSEVFYKVNYIDNQYNSINNDKYISNMVDYIDISYEYNNIISEYISGYYKYNVDSYLITYEDDITNSLWERKYELLNEKVFVIDENNVNNIKIEDSFRVDFKKYRDEIYEFVNNYDIEVSGYLHIRINILEFLNFNSLDNEYADNKVITINIPLTSDTFKMNIENINDNNSYYEFSNKVSMNIVFLLIGTLCLSISLAILAIIIKQFRFIYEKQSRYNKELKMILSKYDNCIVRIKRFYVNRKYNMIYVDSFKELMDVYDSKNKMISFKEIKRDSESIFVIIDGDDAWIYRLISDNIK